MALISRISRLFKADFHAVLDQVEEPAMLLRQAIREMEDGLSDSEHRLHITAAETDQLKTRQDELEHALVEMDEQLDVCFESDKDDLARDLIRRKLETRRLHKRVAANLSAAQKSLLAQQKALDENRATLDSMKQKAELFAERSPQTGCSHRDFAQDNWNARDLCVQDNEVEVAFLREKKRRGQS